MESNHTEPPFWHALSCEALFNQLQSNPQGLDSVEVKRRLTKFGFNQMQQKSREGPVRIFFRQFHNALIYILLVSTGLALLLGKITDAIVVFSVVILNTIIGFFQEYRSSRTIQSLLQMIPQSSTVMRNGVTYSIPSSEIVPGDLVILQAGDRVAADIRLFSVKNLCCDESALTGESLPVSKRIEPLAEDTPLAERKCMAYNGTLVTTGTGSGLVVATGQQTELGKISQLLEQISSFETPLMRTLAQIARWITICVFFMGLGLFAVGFFRGYSMLDAALASIALAVAAIPEGLPATITIAASIGVHRMARRRAIIRHLLAVETLGSTTVICTDKTGTLTQNEMTVQSIWTPRGSCFVTGIGYSNEGQISLQEFPSDAHDGHVLHDLLRAALLCNDATLERTNGQWIPSGDPTELALLVASLKGGLDETAIRKEWPRIDVIPFESERRMMATLHRSVEGQTSLIVKGAPEELLQLCKENTSAAKEYIEQMTHQGMRLIAVAQKNLPATFEQLTEKEIEGDLSLLGIFSMFDPPRLGVSQAIKASQRAGITVKMITGDHPITAAVIGKEIGLLEGKVITGAEIDQCDEITLQRMVIQNHIFARTLPEHKLKITEALQEQGHVVAMTGDGVNDAPALKRANIGVAMGMSGTAVAKEAADMLLADDNFLTIEAAVEEGRRVYDNLIKSIVFMFPVNLAQALVIFFAVLFFPIHSQLLLMPISPVQILWVNLVVAVALALPLAFEAMEPDIMNRPPRNPNAPILSAFIVVRTIVVALTMAIGTILVFLWQYGQGADLSKAQSVAVTTLMFFQLFYLFNCRSLRFSLIKIGILSNRYVLLGVFFVIIAQLLFIYIPFMNTLFHTEALSGNAWLISIAIGVTIFPLIALEKWLTNSNCKLFF